MEKIPQGIGMPPEFSKLDNTKKLLKEAGVWKKEQEAQKKEAPKKGKVEETEKNKPENQEKEKSKKEKKEKPASKEIVAHFQEELKKLEDFPGQKEYQKIKKCDRALELVEDWLPFGYLDNFQGVTKILSILEAAKPKTALTFGKIQKDIARKIAYEMAFQYPMWEKKNAGKTKIIRNFVNKWLKDKNSYYQAGKKWEDFWSKGTKKEYLQSRAENGYFFEGNIFGNATSKDRFEPDKSLKSFAFSTGNLIKLASGRDQTLSEICNVLAAQGVAYRDLRSLTNDIENQYIKQRTISQLLQIEEQTDDKKLAFFLKEKKRLGTFPQKPLKIGFLEKLVEEKINSKEISPQLAELLFNIIADSKEEAKNKEARGILGKLQSKVKNLNQEEVTKEQKELSPKAQQTINKAKEFVKKGKKKESIWGTIGNVAGWSLFLFLILFFTGEMKAIEKMTGIETGAKKK